SLSRNTRSRSRQRGNSRHSRKTSRGSAEWRSRTSSTRSRASHRASSRASESRGSESFHIPATVGSKRGEAEAPHEVHRQFSAARPRDAVFVPNHGETPSAQYRSRARRDSGTAGG